jgi:hypothetical protein
MAIAILRNSRRVQSCIADVCETDISDLLTPESAGLRVSLASSAAAYQIEACDAGHIAGLGVDGSE